MSKDEIIEGNRLFAVVYKIENKVNGKMYIGSSTKFDKRIKSHFRDLKSGKHHCPPLQKAYNKHGKDSFLVDILEKFEYVTKEEVLKREQFYLDKLNPIYNICKIAGSQLGSKRNDEFKTRCSERMKGKTPWNKNKKTGPQSEITKTKRSRALSGHKVSDSIRARISEALCGKPLSAKHREMLSVAKLSGTNNDKSVVSTNEFGQITEYRSVCEASRLSGVALQTIYDSLKNKPKKWKRNTSQRLTWTYKPLIA